MNVKRLIELLQKEDPERLVVISKDSVGSSFRQLYDISKAAFSCGEIGIECLTYELLIDGFTDQDVLEDGKPCIVLWPV